MSLGSLRIVCITCIGENSLNYELVDSGRWQEGHDYVLKAMPFANRLAESRQDDPDVHGHLAMVEGMCGTCDAQTAQALRNQKKTTQADATFAQGRQLLEASRTRCLQTLDRFPDSNYVRQKLVYAVRKLGDWHMKQKNIDEAEKCFNEMLSQVTHIADGQPPDSYTIMDLSTAFERLGNISQARNNREQALERYLKSLEYAIDSGRMAPDNDKVQWDVSFSYQHVADSYLIAGNNKEAREAALKCAEIRGRLAQADTQNSHLHVKLFHALGTLTKACERDGAFEEALKWHQQQLQFAQNFNGATNSKRFESQIQQAQAGIKRCSESLAAEPNKDNAEPLPDTANE